jgi:hypothetical protein
LAAFDGRIDGKDAEENAGRGEIVKGGRRERH